MKAILYVLLASALGFVVVGCKPQEKATTGAESTPPDTTASQGNGNSEVGIAPMAPGAGGISPVSGSDSVTGAGGGGVGQAAKEKAKSVAGSQSEGGPKSADDE